MIESLLRISFEFVQLFLFLSFMMDCASVRSFIQTITLLGSIIFLFIVSITIYSTGCIGAGRDVDEERKHHSAVPVEKAHVGFLGANAWDTHQSRSAS